MGRTRSVLVLCAERTVCPTGQCRRRSLMTRRFINDRQQYLQCSLGRDKARYNRLSVSLPDALFLWREERRNRAVNKNKVAAIEGRGVESKERLRFEIPGALSRRGQTRYLDGSRGWRQTAAETR